MQNDEAHRFIDEEMRPRWTHWEPTPAQVSDWASWLRPFTWDSAKAAIRRYVSEAKYGREPEPGRLVATLRAFAPAVQNTAHDGPNPTDVVKRLWIVCMGGGQVGRGYYVAAPYKVDARTALVERLAGLYGGDWKVFENATEREIIAMRFELQGGIPPLPGENWKDYAERIGTIDKPESVNEQVRELLATEGAKV